MAYGSTAYLKERTQNLEVPAFVAALQPPPALPEAVLSRDKLSCNRTSHN